MSQTHLPMRAADEQAGPKLSSTQQRAFRLAQQAAQRALRRRFRVAKLTKDAYLKMGRHEGALSRIGRDLHTCVRLTKAWVAKEYRDLPWTSLLYIVAAIVYFVNPADLIPDVLTGIGFVDDVAVVGAVVRSVHADLEAFRAWDRRRKATPSLKRVRELHQSAAAA